MPGVRWSIKSKFPLAPTSRASRVQLMVHKRRVFQWVRHFAMLCQCSSYLQRSRDRWQVCTLACLHLLSAFLVGPSVLSFSIHPRCTSFLYLNLILCVFAFKQSRLRIVHNWSILVHFEGKHWLVRQIKFAFSFRLHLGAFPIVGQHSSQFFLSPSIAP